METLRSESPVWRFFVKLIQIIYVSVIWIVFSLPVITAGASTAALFFVCLRLCKNEEGYIFRDFWKSFRREFKQATILWIVFLALGGFFLWDAWLMGQSQASFAPALRGVYLGALMLVLLVGSFVFAVLSRYTNTLRGTVTNAALMMARHFPTTLCMAAILISVLAFALFVFPPVFVVAPGVIAYLDSLLLVRVFARYEGPAEDDTDAGA